METIAGNGRERESGAEQNKGRMKQEPGAVQGVGEHPAELDWLCQNPGNCSDSALALHVEPCS